MSITKAAALYTTARSSEAAGRELGASICAALDGRPPHVVILFASPEYDYAALLAALQESCAPAILVGCSSAGEFSGARPGNSSASVMAIHSTDMLFNAIIGRGLRSDRSDALAQIAPVFTARDHPGYAYRSALVLTDALAGYADELVHGINVQTAGTYQLFGGGAADDARFDRTHIFHGLQAVNDAVVVLEILSKRPLGLGVRHGWKPSGSPLRVTEADGRRLVSLNASTAAEVFERHALATGRVFDRDNALPFFLHNIIGIECGDQYNLRVPLSVEADGAILCAAEVPLGATVHIMTATVESACAAARDASKAALDGLQGAKLAGSLVFDCVATRLSLGHAFEDELSAVAEALGSSNFAGCNTYGQIARANGQFSGFHNCTAIVCAIPE